MADISTLIDTFGTGAVDTTKWTANAWGGTVAVTDGKLILTPTNNTASAGAELASLATDYSLTNSKFYVNVRQVANGTVDTEIWLNQDTSNGLAMFTEDGTLYARKKVASSVSNPDNITYNSTTMAWWQIREASGTTYWEYSSDGSDWTTLHSESTPITITSMEVVLSTYEWEAVDPAGAAWFDSVNTILPETRYIPYSGVGTIDSDGFNDEVTLETDNIT